MSRVAGIPAGRPAVPGLAPPCRACRARAARFSRLVRGSTASGRADAGTCSTTAADARRGRRRRRSARILCVHGNPTWSYLWRAPGRRGDGCRCATGAPRLARDRRRPARDGLLRAHRRRCAPLADGSPTSAPSPTRSASTGPVVTVGHDWGGVVSLGWAVDHPDLLAGVVLLNTAVHQPDDRADPRAAARSPSRRACSDRATVGDAGVPRDDAVARAPAARRPTSRDGLPRALRSADRRGGHRAIRRRHPRRRARTRASPSSTASRRGVAALDVPALMLWGPRDPVFSDRYLDDLRRPDAARRRPPLRGRRAPRRRGRRVRAGRARLAGQTDSVARPGTSSSDAEPVDRATPMRRTSSSASADATPLWHHARRRSRDSAEPALVDMVAGPGGSPRVVTWALLSTRVHQLAAGLVAVGRAAGRPGLAARAAERRPHRRALRVPAHRRGRRRRRRRPRPARPRAAPSAAPAPTTSSARCPASPSPRALGWPGRRISVGHAARRARRAALGVDDTRSAELSSAPARLRTTVALPHAARAPSDRRRRALHLGLDRSGEGRRYTHAPAQRPCATPSPRQYDLGAGTGLVAGFAPFALLGPALGARSVTPDMDVTVAAHPHGARPSPTPRPSRRRDRRLPLAGRARQRRRDGRRALDADAARRARARPHLPLGRRARVRARCSTAASRTHAERRRRTRPTA